MLDMESFRETLFDPNNENPSGLQELCLAAEMETFRRFGKTIELYTPLYISNFCVSACTYCNYSKYNANIERRRLSLASAASEMIAIANRKISDILLLTGDEIHPDRISVVVDHVRLARKVFARVGAEIFPCETEEYRNLHDAGLDYITIYQETYDEKQYRRFHRAGPKRNYAYRFEAPTRALTAGIRGINIGVLLGLADPYRDLYELAGHLRQLRRQFWDREFSVSFPRIRDRKTPYYVSDALLAKAVFLFRLLFPDITLVLSTRESPRFRDGILGKGINKISSGSRTTVGGYTSAANQPTQDNGQFDIDDIRPTSGIIASIKKLGFSPILKNHEPIYR